MNHAEDNVRLKRLRSAAIAKHAQTLLADRCAEPIESLLVPVVGGLCPGLIVTDVEDRRRQTGVPLPLEEAREFACLVWRTERPRASPLQMFRQEDLNEATRRADFDPICAAEARWALPFADRIGLKRTGDLAGTVGLVPYIDVTDEALNQLSLLHEIAHLLVDTDVTLQGHNQVWSDEFGRLIGTHVDPFTRTEWEVLWKWAVDWAARRVAQDPRWLSDLLDKRRAKSRRPIGGPTVRSPTVRDLSGVPAVSECFWGGGQPLRLDPVCHRPVGMRLSPAFGGTLVQRYRADSLAGRGPSRPTDTGTGALIEATRCHSCRPLLWAVVSTKSVAPIRRSVRRR